MSATSRTVLVLALVLGVGGVFLGGYWVGRDHGGIHCPGIYVSPRAVALVRFGIILPSYVGAVSGRSVQPGCLTLHRLIARAMASIHHPRLPARVEGLRLTARDDAWLAECWTAMVATPERPLPGPLKLRGHPNRFLQCRASGVVVTATAKP